MKKFQILVMLLWLSVCLAGAVESKIRLVHGPYLQNLRPDEVTIVWLSDKPSVGWVELAPDDDTNFYATERPKYYDARNGVKNTSTIHTVKIKGLKPGTNYRYRVFVQEVLSHVGHKIIYGNYASTDVYSKKPLVFKTSDPADNSVSFAMVNDIHGKNDLLTNLVSKCDLKKTDFFLLTVIWCQSSMRKIISSTVLWIRRPSCLPLRFRCIIQEATTKHVALLQPSSNVISLQKKRISTIHFGKVRSVLSFWIRERTSRIPILNMPV